MNKKHLFYAMAASLAFTACSNEEFGYQNPAEDGDKVAVADLNLVFNREQGDAETRASWSENAKGELTFKWTNATDAIGMVYTGQNGVTGVTNYKFVVDSLQLADFKVKTPGQARWTGYYQLSEELAAVQALYTRGDGTTALTAADYGASASAKFKTTNDEILKGYYVAYYPHNGEYKNAGEKIIVSSPKVIDNIDATTAKYASNLEAVAKHTFGYSTPAVVAAGKQVTNFNLKNLSSALRIRIANEANLDAAKKIKSVVLRTRGNDAFVVKGRLNNPSAVPSKDVIDVDAEGGKTATLFVNYASEKELPLAAGKNATTAKDTVDVYFPVLPTALAEAGIDVILIGTDNKACVLEANFKSTGATLGAGKRLNLNTKVTTATKFDQAFVTTATDLQSALTTAQSQTSMTTINLLGDITAPNLTCASTAIADFKGGVKITASAGSTLTLTNPSFTLPYGDGTTTQDAVLTIEAPLTINGGDILGHVAVNGKTTIKGTLNIGKANNATDFYPGKLDINGEASIEKSATLKARYSYGTVIAKGATLTVKAGGKLVNDNWLYTAGTAQYKSDLIINGTLKVDGTLTDGGDTEIGADGKLVINGEASNNNTLNVKGGSIEVNGKLTNKKADTTTANVLCNAGNIKVVTGALTVAASGKIYNEASLNCMGTFTNNGTFYDYVGSVYGGKPFSSDGVYACYVNSQSRLGEAVNRLNLYAANNKQTIVLQNDGNALIPSTAYYFDDIAADKALKLNVENEGNVTIQNKYTGVTAPTGYVAPVPTLNSLSVNNGTTSTVTLNWNINFAGKDVAPITIKDKADKTAKPGVLDINNNITVKANGEIVNFGTFNLKEAANTSALPASVYCKSADVTKGTWTNYPIVDETGSFWN